MPHREGQGAFAPEIGRAEVKRRLLLVDWSGTGRKCQDEQQSDGTHYVREPTWKLVRTGV